VTEKGPRAPRPTLAQASNEQAPKRFAKSLRVRRRVEFQIAQKGGSRLHTDWFVVIVVKRSPELGERPRLGVTASRKTGNAVVRNRTKRLVREWFRQNVNLLPGMVDIIVIFRPDLPWLGFDEIDRALARLVPKIKKLAEVSTASRPHRGV
jgi:ribonuclease P protein component